MSAARRIAACAVHAAGIGRDVVQTGPFRACFDPVSDLIWMNYAVPIDALGSDEETLDQLRQLKELFASRARRLRFEFVDGVWPDLPRLLEQFGLNLQGQLPLMTATPESFRPYRNENVHVRMIGPDEIALFSSLQIDSFEMEGWNSEAGNAHTKLQVEKGFWRCAVATMDGIPAAAGTLIPHDGVAELAGVGTLPKARRKGVAATLSSFLVAAHFQSGGDLIWLSAANEEGLATYRKIGFDMACLQWNYLL